MSDKQEPKRGGPVKPERLRREAQRRSIEALEALVSIMKGDGQATARLAAARELLDRGYGRPRPMAAEDGENEPLTVVLRQFSPPDEEVGA